MKILLVEDDWRIASSLKQGLEQELYSVKHEVNGREGLAEAQDASYDLIILDVMLPEMDGFAIAKALRESKIATPILFLTARSGRDDKVRGLDLGGDDYLGKPFSLEELLARVRALLRRPPKIQSQKIVVGDITLDTTARKVFIKKQEIAITRRQYMLFEHLLKNRGKVYSKSDLIDKVWEYESEVLENTVEVTVRGLRKALGVYGDTVSTIRGFGYTVRKEK